MTDASSSPSMPGVNWWMWEVAGAITLVVGVVVLLEPGKSLETLAVITGIFLLCDALMAFITAMGHDADGSRALPAIHCVFSLVTGLILVRHSLGTVEAIAIFIGIWFLTVGCIRTVGAFSLPDHRGVRLAIGLLEAVAGAVIIAQPHIGYNTLAIITGISLALQGIGLMILGMGMRKVEHDEASTTLSPAAT